MSNIWSIYHNSKFITLLFLSILPIKTLSVLWCYKIIIINKYLPKKKRQNWSLLSDHNSINSFFLNIGLISINLNSITGFINIWSILFMLDLLNIFFYIDWIIWFWSKFNHYLLIQFWSILQIQTLFIQYKTTFTP